MEIVDTEIIWGLYKGDQLMYAIQVINPPNLNPETLEDELALDQHKKDVKLAIVDSLFELKIVQR